MHLKHAYKTLNKETFSSLNVSILLTKRKQKPLYKGFFLLPKYYEFVCVGHTTF